MTKQTRLIQAEDLPLWSGVPPTIEETVDGRDALLIVTQQLEEEQARRMQLERDVREWMVICEGLRAMLEQAKAQVDAMADANAEVGAEYIQTVRWARAWKQAAKNERETRHILQVLLIEYEAHGRIAPVPVPIVGVISAATTEGDWKAIWARVGEAE